MTAQAKQTTVNELSVEILPDEGRFVARAVAIAADALRGGIGARGEAAAVLATGNSQLRFLEGLVTAAGIDWAKVTLFHLDEYLGIGALHAASFRRYLRERVGSRVAPREFHYIAGDAPEPIAECERYEELLRAQPIDLCCLGIGENGHLAFNDPPVARFAEARWVKIVKLDEVNRVQQAGYGHFKSVEEVPRHGITLTIPAILSASHVLCLAQGAKKREVVRRMLREPVAESCPASALRTRAGSVLLLDDAAAGAL